MAPRKQPHPIMSQGTASMQLKDQVAIVTGSATGIGAACAERLAALGARVVVNCTKSVSDAEATIDRIHDRRSILANFVVSISDVKVN